MLIRCKLEKNGKQELPILGAFFWNFVLLLLQYAYTRQNYVLIVGNPIAGTGAGLRPIGKDPNFVEDLREIFNISVPILHEGDETNSFKVTKHTGNGKNKWPNPQYVTSNWREVVSTVKPVKKVSTNLGCKIL